MRVTQLLPATRIYPPLSPERARISTRVEVLEEHASSIASLFALQVAMMTGESHEVVSSTFARRVDGLQVLKTEGSFPQETTRGIFNAARGSIALKASLGKSETTSTLVHEVAHAVSVNELHEPVLAQEITQTFVSGLDHKTRTTAHHTRIHQPYDASSSWLNEALMTHLSSCVLAAEFNPGHSTEYAVLRALFLAEQGLEGTLYQTAFLGGDIDSVIQHVDSMLYNGWTEEIANEFIRERAQQQICARNEMPHEKIARILGPELTKLAHF